MLTFCALFFVGLLAIFLSYLLFLHPKSIVYLFDTFIVILSKTIEFCLGQKLIYLFFGYSKNLELVIINIIKYSIA